MADVFTKEKRSRVMAAIRSSGNKATEVRLAGIFRRARMTGWRRHLAITGRPDFAFRARRVAVFVDGCYWHGCARHHRLPADNRAYWLRKLERNRERDRIVTRTLRRDGWRVVRLWEHDLANEARVLRRVLAALEKGGGGANRSEIEIADISKNGRGVFRGHRTDAPGARKRGLAGRAGQRHRS